MAIVKHALYDRDRTEIATLRGVLAREPKLSLEPKSRKAFDAMIAMVPSPQHVAYEEGVVGGVPGWWCRPADFVQDAAILYLHGGAFILGSATAYGHFVGQLAKRTKVPAFVADYALAPERPFPGAIDDAQAAYNGLVASGFSNIGLCGDSAGGGLALSLLLLNSRDANHPKAAAAMSPWIDLSLRGDTMKTRNDADPVLSGTSLEAAARMYIAGWDRDVPEASALNGDFHEMPPVRIHVGDAEVLLDDALRFAGLAEDARRSCDVHVWEGMTHVFSTNLALRAAEEALDDIGAFLCQHLA